MLSNIITVHCFVEYQFNDFLGKLLTFADTLGLEKTQSDAYKSIIKQEVWDLWEQPKYIEDKDNSIHIVDESVKI